VTEPKNGGDFPLQSTGVFALVLAVIGLIWTGPAPLIDERPISRMKSDTDIGQIQDVDARMWQDPLGVILDELKKSPHDDLSLAVQQGGKEKLRVLAKKTKRSESNTHTPEVLFNRAFEKEPTTTRNYLQLAVMIPGGPYPVEEEGRRRKRYAVLAALATLGYTPEESEHIGYFKTESSKPLYLPDVVPFEFFEKEDGAVRDRVVVLWLDDSKFDTEVDKRIHAIFELAKPQNEKSFTTTNFVIGPNNSKNLKALLANNIDKSDVSPKNHITYFAAGATVENSKLGIPENADQYNPSKHLLRTIADDYQVSKKLAEELKLRQVNRNEDHILLISEWDTLYGRSFPNTFTQAYKDDRSAKCMPMTNLNENKSSSDAMVYCASYMKGIDGLLPTETQNKTEGSQDTQKKPDTIQINNNIDQPDGNHQQDYLRRMVERIRKLDNTLREKRIPNPFKNNGISAIGIVGSDVYDKLMILQALRTYFPGKLFFTTDLDAAYFLPRELPYTHNLIVASGFGLNLAAKIQMATSPFRDSYQTADFFATKLATSTWEKHIVDEKCIAAHLADWIGKPEDHDVHIEEPRIFEIGRKGPVDLSTNINIGNSNECAKNTLVCSHIHPRPDTGESKHNIYPFIKLLTFGFGLLLLYRMSWDSRKIFPLFSKLDAQIRKTNVSTKGTGLGIECAIMFLFVVAGMAVSYLIYKIVTGLGTEEPFSLWNGISTWPSNLLQLFALIASVWALRTIWKKCAKIEEEIEMEFMTFHETSDATRQAIPASKILYPLAVNKWEPKVLNSAQLDVTALWSDFKTFGKHKNRYYRAILGTLFFVSFGICAVMLSGGQPVPSRGDASFYIDVALELSCVFTIVYLIMWVVDAERLVSKFIEHLSIQKQSNWPSIRHPKWGWAKVSDQYVAYWLDVEFVAQYTRVMGQFIWYPIPSLLLLGIAKSIVFDNWIFSPGLLAAITILLVYLFSIAFLLQRTARNLRTKALGKLNKDLRLLRDTVVTDEKEIIHLEKMITEIRNNDEGAFTPFLHQPLVQALLTFLSGTGGAFVLMDRFF
jgi:hypothetical protein